METPEPDRTQLSADPARLVKPQFDWSREDLRSQVKVGTVLMASDYGYIWVEEVTEEGVLDRGPFADRHLRTWDYLTDSGCIIVEQSNESASPPPTLTVRERRGTVPPGTTREPGILEGEQQLPVDFKTDRLDIELSMELIDLIPSDWLFARLEAEVSSGQVTQVVVSNTDRSSDLKPSPLLYSGIRVLHALTGRRQHRNWTSLTLTVKRNNSTG